LTPVSVLSLELVSELVMMLHMTLSSFQDLTYYECIYICI
jgi:hypothetical protein